MAHERCLCIIDGSLLLGWQELKVFSQEAAGNAEETDQIRTIVSTDRHKCFPLKH